MQLIRTLEILEFGETDLFRPNSKNISSFPCETQIVTRIICTMNKTINICATSHIVMKSAVCRHLAISPIVTQAYLEQLACPKFPKDRVDMADLWRRMWGIYDVPADMITAMSAPLLTVEDVASLVHVTPKTIRNAGNNRCPDWNLPMHVDIGPRIRRYLPLHIMAWMSGAPMVKWLQRQNGPTGPQGLRLRPVQTGITASYDSVAEASKNNGKYDEGSYHFGSANNTGLRHMPQNSEQDRK